MDQALHFSESPSGGADAASVSADTEDPRGQIQVFLIDDHPAIREVLRTKIEGREGLRVMGESASAADALPPIERHTPDVVVVDLSIGGKDGLTLIERIRSRAPGSRILVFSIHDERVYAERAIRAGASGYVMKDEPAQEVVRAIEEVGDGQVYLSQPIASRILSNLIRDEDPAAPSRLGALTDRELTVFRKLGEGYGVDQITEQLELSRKTVETHRRQAKEKLGCETVDELLRYAVRRVNGPGGAESGRGVD